MCDKVKFNRRRLGFATKELAIMVRRVLDQAVFDENISGAQGGILRYLSERQKTDVYQRDLERDFNIRRSSVTGALQAMEKKQLIQRTAVENDARLKKITLTEEGMNLHCEIDKRIQNFDRKLEENINVDDLEIFYKVAEQAKENLLKMESEVMTAESDNQDRKKETKKL